MNNNSNKFTYCGVSTTPRTHCNTNSGYNHNPVGADREYISLGEKIFKMIETGEDIGEKINPIFDGNEVDDLDVTKSFRHDRMDIAEQYGKMVDADNAPIVSDDEGSEDE